jgi:hypothetical protein
MRYLKEITLISLLTLPVIGVGQSSDTDTIRPSTGQPAADVLGSHDLWGNPTFIGGITNKGPDSESTW